MSGLTRAENKRIDFIVLVLLTVLGCAYTVVTTNSYIGRDLFGAFIFCLPGITYLGFRAPKPWQKILLSGFIFGLLFGIFFEFIQQFNRSYTIAFSVLPKVFSVVSLDFVIWHLLMSLYVFTFYEHFINTKARNGVSHRYKPILLTAVVVIALTIGLYYVRPQYLFFRYPYMYFGTLAIIPTVILALKRPHYIHDIVLVAPFFFFFYLAIEWVAVPRHWWVYAGNNYIGWVTISDLRFPFEELFYWMLLYPATLVALYKIFIDRPDNVIRAKASHQ